MNELIGGILVGISTFILMLFLGRIAGISGMINKVIDPESTGRAWPLAFLFGLTAVPAAYYRLSGGAVPVVIETPLPLLIAAGFLVGFGTRLGAGCTSGHGVCGMALFSIRSISATLTFLSTGIVTVFIIRHLV